jgi:CheY-like chemotaxis protein
MAAPSIHGVDDQSSNVPFLKQTLKHERIRNVPMIFVTAPNNQKSKREGLSAGAVDDTHQV